MNYDVPVVNSHVLRILRLFALFELCFYLVDSGCDVLHLLVEIRFFGFELFLVVFDCCQLLFGGWCRRAWWIFVGMWRYVVPPTSSEISSKASTEASSPTSSEASSESGCWVQVSGNGMAGAIACCSSSFRSATPWSFSVSFRHFSFTSIFGIMHI